jgi:dTDP-4-dehydrorhamnose reductase
MIWLIGNKGMLGYDVERILNQYKSFEFIASDTEIDIINYDKAYSYVKDKNITWIINCSGYTAVDKAEGDKEQAFQINSDGVKNLSEIAKIKNAKLIHLSTDYVFDGDNLKPYKEDYPTNPINVYGESKLSGENRIKENYDRYFIIRISWLFGKNGKNFVNTMLRLFREKSIVKVVSDQKGSPTYTKCVAELILNIIKNTSEQYGIYHFTNEGITTWYDFARYIYDIALHYQIVKPRVNILPVNTSEFHTKARRPKNSSLSKDKIKNILNFNPISWNDAVRSYIKECYKE